MSSASPALLSTEGLTKRFKSKGGLPRRTRQEVLAVQDVSLSVAKGATLGIVGESGSGKTTLARMIVGLIPPTSGAVLVEGTPTASLSPAALHRRIQYVFQDPFSALNPRRTVGQSIEVPLRYLTDMDRAGRAAEVASLLERTGLRPELANSYPHELSGGQRQRVVIARAISANPDVLVLDEPVSALDVSVQAQILALLRRLQQDSGMTYLFISHDLAVIEHASDDVIVMSAGVVVERGPRSQVFASPQHSYTRALLAAVPGRRRQQEEMNGLDPTTAYPGANT